MYTAHDLPLSPAEYRSRLARTNEAIQYRHNNSLSFPRSITNANISATTTTTPAMPNLLPHKPAKIVKNSSNPPTGGYATGGRITTIVARKKGASRIASKITAKKKKKAPPAMRNRLGLVKSAHSALARNIAQANKKKMRSKFKR